jgi:hypothetical protein
MALKCEIILVNGKQLVLAFDDIEFIDSVSRVEKSIKEVLNQGGNAQKRIINWRNVATIRVTDFE